MYVEMYRCRLAFGKSKRDATETKGRARRIRSDSDHGGCYSVEGNTGESNYYNCITCIALRTKGISDGARLA